MIYFLIGSVVIDTGPQRGDVPTSLQYKASLRTLPLVENFKLQDELIDADIKYGNLPSVIHSLIISIFCFNMQLVMECTIKVGFYYLLRFYNGYNAVNCLTQAEA